MRQRISSTALYGGVTRGPKIVGDEARAALRRLLAAIEDGSFVAEMKKTFAGREATLAAARNERLEAAAAEFAALIKRRRGQDK